MTAQGRVVITRVGKAKPRLVLDQLGDDTLSGGHGGWQTIDRPGRSSLSTWTGTPALVWTIPASLDGTSNNVNGVDESVEADVDTLLAWANPTEKDDPEPPKLSVQAPTGRGPSTARWVLNGIEWGEQLRNPAGQRVRQDVTLTLLEYVPGNVLRGPAAKSRGNKGKNSKGGKDKGKGGK